jgi:FtsP/CotA-like multicopper oxidase with cupredoxin domain
MLKRLKFAARSSALVSLTGCLAIGLIAPCSVLAADNGGGRKCPGQTSEAGDDPSGFPIPHVRRSSNEVLRTTLHACISDIEILDQNAQPPETAEIHPPTFEGTIPGPTLVVKPGDKLSILVVNDLPTNPPNERANRFPHDEYTLNLHTHGLTVSPLGISDNIFREMAPGTANQVEIQIPKDHPTGTYWYHVHKHGSANFQFFSGMAGFLIVKGGEGTLDAVPEVVAARDVPMAFQVIRATNDGTLVFVHQQAQQFGTFPFPDHDPPPTTEQQGLWSTYGLDGGPTVASDGSFTGPPSRFSYTTNGIANPTLHMRPGEVQRWRLLNASDGDNLQMVLVSKDDPKQGLGLNVVAMDAITVPKTYAHNPGDPLVIASGQRMDVMVKAGKPGTYLLQTLDPDSGVVQTSVSPYRDAQYPNGIDPATRVSRHSADFPTPCPPLGGKPEDCEPGGMRFGEFSYPVTLATIEVSGQAKDMDLPADALPTLESLPSIDTMLNKKPDVVRNVVFEDCGDVPDFKTNVSLPSCGWYFAKYDKVYWGGSPFYNLLMMRDADDKGQPNPGSTDMPLVNFKKEGLFDPTQPLFPDMIAGNYEEWTVTNRTLSDHPFHLHQNHVLITKINGITLPQPEWHDTLNVPAIVCVKDLGCAMPQDVTKLPPGSITFRTYFNPVTAGCFVGHCHIIDHEDLGMMQRFDILPAPGQPSGCGVDEANRGGLKERLFAGNFRVCSAPQFLAGSRRLPAP